MWTHTTPDGIEYVVTVEPEEVRRRMAALIVALWPTYLELRAQGRLPRAPVGRAVPESAGGVEEAHTVSDSVGSMTPQPVNGKLALTQPRSPARGPDRAGSPFSREGASFLSMTSPSPGGEGREPVRTDRDPAPTAARAHGERGEETAPVHRSGAERSGRPCC